ncbi:N,N-dimethylformamidase large subunit [Limibaculum sp. FT325]|uniref:N,N-dimethylformamidase beta subunit family domain-containing protein n=1 Tax=Thermohalobaculum sediminis TaxID=2939436 RepID=UPI0020C0202E|nr:N,N-dimethylformamidase beta subunit family domain-containing protein [Limibaculum sediminis]MCL5778295.1 N,N-dimethylformamidase large subunit [Limibaculum sediminis]
MIPLTGYTDRLSARPGEAIAFRISSSGEGPYDARLVRIVCGDPNPAGPGRIEHDLGHVFSGRFPSRVQTHDIGSMAVVEAGVQPAGAVTLEAMVWPTLPGRGAQAVFSAFDPETGAGVALGLDETGAAMVVIGRAGQAPVAVSTGRPLATRHWARLRASIDPATGAVEVGQEALHPPFGRPEVARATGSIPPGPVPLAPRWHIAALGVDGTGRSVRHFNGKIEAPAILLGLPAGVLGDAAGCAPVARWDFSRDIPGTAIRDTGPNRLDGRLVNLPARGMTGAAWTGREMCWRHAPDQYGAIHFHDTDLADCGWETDFTFTVPADLPSGVYGMRLTCGGEADTIPFFVPAARGRRGADLCVLIPTFTYVVYGNFDRPDFDDTYRARAAELGMGRHFPSDHPEYGFSTYNTHSDGSGVCHSSHLRPLMTLRPGYLNQVDRAGSGLRHFSADTHLLAWLDARGIAFDVITDHELDAEGLGAIAGYRALLTTTHPEYHTAATLDALVDYRNGGGRFCYLGGNGFYWRVARHPEMPEAIEIRRGEGGIRAWASEPGEYFNAFDGAYGGLWRRQGRPPQSVAGVGFSAQGTFEGSHYRLAPGARDPRAAWIFEGVEGEVLGDFGLSGGGAAGFELDRADTRLGTPAHALILARSEGHSERFVLVHEEQLTHLVTLPGEPARDLIRAEIVFYETPAGGAVFATGSITFCGSLPHDRFHNPVSRMMENVVRRFLDPAPFAMPG